jgi:hypothetical protein
MAQGTQQKAIACNSLKWWHEEHNEHKKEDEN